MARTFRCPSCGASLDWDGDDDPAVTCAYCSSTVLVPEELRPDRRTIRSAFPESGASMTVDLGDLTGSIAALKIVRGLARNGRQSEAASLYSRTFGASLGDAERLVADIAAGRSVAVTGTRLGLPLRVVSGTPSGAVSGATGMPYAEVLLDPSGLVRKVRRRIGILTVIIVIMVLAAVFFALYGTLGRIL